MGFSRQEYWTESPGDLPNPGRLGTEPGTPVLQADSLPAELPGTPNRLRHVILCLFNVKRDWSYLIKRPECQGRGKEQSFLLWFLFFKLPRHLRCRVRAYCLLACWILVP